MVVRRFNYYRFFVFVVVLSVIIFTTYKLISNYKYKQTYEYKLSLVGYKEDEISDPSDMNEYYSKEDEERYGVVGIELKLK